MGSTSARKQKKKGEGKATFSLEGASPKKSGGLGGGGGRWCGAKRQAEKMRAGAVNQKGPGKRWRGRRWVGLQVEKRQGKREHDDHSKLRRLGAARRRRTKGGEGEKS